MSNRLKRDICCTGYRPTPFTSFLEAMKKEPKVRTEVINTNHYPMLVHRLAYNGDTMYVFSAV